MPASAMIVPTLCSLVCAAAGWYYLLHAGGAEKLGDFERPADNRLRIRLRRWGGAGMVVIAIAFYAGMRIASYGNANPVAVALCLAAVVILLPIVVFLAYVDLRLTRKMRQSHGKPKR